MTDSTTCFNCGGMYAGEGSSDPIRAYESPDSQRITLCGVCVRTFGCRYGGYVIVMEDGEGLPACPERVPKITMIADRVRALHVSDQNGYGPGDCHCEECQDTMDELRIVGDFILDLQGRGIETPYDEGGVLA